MKFTTSLKTGAFRWACPFVLLLTLFYYFAGQSTPLSAYHGYAPALVASPLMTLYALAYAVAAGLGAWESGRLKSARVWNLAPTRSRYAIACNVLIPIVLLSWLVLIVPISLSLIRAETLPTVDSMKLPIMAMILCVAHSAIGFSIGLLGPQVITAPITAVATWVLVAFSRAVQPYWIRHVSGQYADLSFGEAPSMTSLLVPVLFGAGIASAAVLLWLPTYKTGIKVVLALSVGTALTFSAYNIARSWPHDPPLVTGNISMECLGDTPEVCMPKETSAALAKLQQEASAALGKLRDNDVVKTPELITDSFAEGRTARPSTDRVWRLNLTSAAEQHDLTFRIAASVVRFPCENVNIIASHSALRWATSVTGSDEQYAARISQEGQDPGSLQREKQVTKIVATVRRLPAKEQGQWFKANLTAGCQGA
jgi:hypothetical protein